uniref:Octaketide synthase n=1 Tax=Hypericum perforatum TaxID=65561 RepID=A0A224XFQ3_HYPPE
MGSLDNGSARINNQKANGLASILAIGTALPPICIKQDDYPDYYFRVTKSDHKTQLKEKFRRICEKSGVTKRYTVLTEDMIKENENIITYKAPSLDARQAILHKETPKLAIEAALKTIQEWGQPVSKITHLFFCSSSGGCYLPSSDFQIAKALGLEPTVQRSMVFPHGCYAASSGLRLAKDIAENNKDARVLVVCCELMVSSFHAPSEDAIGMLIGHAIFGDGAACAIVGADPGPTERPIFELVKGGQVIVPDTEDCLGGWVMEMGWIYDLNKRLPQALADNILGALDDTLRLTGKRDDLNGLFYVLHPGGRAIIDLLEEKLELTKDKLESSRRVLSNYGNMWGPALVFTLDEMRRKSKEDNATTTGGGSELGLMMAFGPGLTTEIMVLRSVTL